MTATVKPLAVYIHWPFCLAKCPYCDFNSHVRESVAQDAWRQALLLELAFYAEKMPGRRVTSVFFGGGTPSLMPPETVGALLNAVARHWPVDAGVEITLEANPTSSEASRFKSFRDAGVNRVSLGVQSLEDEALRFLGRQHSSAEALKAVEWAAGIFPRHSFDLIYARHGQTPQAWEAELKRALPFAGDHLSLYQLTIEPGTAFFHAHARGELPVMDDDAAAELYEQTAAIMAEAGLPAYEISNYAAPGGESRHNLAYWRYDDYIGIGPGAHGRIESATTNKKTATFNTRSPEKWLEQVQRTGNGLAEQTAISAEDALAERILMGLRLRDGIDFDAAIKTAMDHTALARFAHAGWLQQQNGRLWATPAGMLRLNAMLPRLIKDMKTV